MFVYLGSDSHVPFSYDPEHLSSAIIVTLVVAVLIIILIIIDVSCYFVNDTGKLKFLEWITCIINSFMFYSNKYWDERTVDFS